MRIARPGISIMTGLPSMFIVGHVDYVRVVRLAAPGSGAGELRVEYLFLPQTLADPHSICAMWSISPIWS
jgi:Rieske 2Fe-2S family protein